MSQLDYEKPQHHFKQKGALLRAVEWRHLHKSYIFSMHINIEIVILVPFNYNMMHINSFLIVMSMQRTSGGSRI